MADELRIRNWEKWQSYRRDRGQPPWIKVHREVMRNPEWVALTDAQRGQLVGIWLLAADRDGVIPASPDLIRKLCYMDETPDLQVFVRRGFIEADANVTTERRQSDETEAEAKAETEGEERQREKDSVSLRSTAADEKSEGGTIAANEILAKWIDRQSHPPSADVKAKQGAVARRLAKTKTREQMIRAWIGMDQLFPHSAGQPWDLFDLERKFANAAEACVNHPELKKESRKRELLKSLEGVA